jgi:hypothetical protein
VSLRINILLLLLSIGLGVKAQSFTYSYTDPCTKELKFIFADMNSPIVISYYGQVKNFSYTELQDGTFDVWLNSTYTNYRTTAPCQGVFTTTTTTTSTTTITSLVNNVMNLNSLTSLDLSSTSLGSSTSVGSTTSSGTTGTNNNKNGSSNNKAGRNGDNNSTSNAGSNSSSGDQSSGQGSNTSSEGQVNGNGNNNGNSEGSGSSSNGNNSGSSSSSSSSSGSSGSNGGSGSGSPTDKKPEEKTPEKIEEQKSETQQAGGSASAKSAAKGKVETQKPAILVTGDIVGVQTVKDQAQDARATMSFTRVKGDGTASIGFAADYMVNAKIGNFNGIRSWMGVNKKGNKHINVLSAGINLMPKSYNGSLLFVRVNSLKNFTALYGAAGSYGQLFEEEVISTLLIGGFMYKGQLTKHIDATVIAASVYAPYTKYYTESLFKSQPIIVPFLNINYSLTKSFKFGLTAGGTYIANQDIVNYQVLMGGKLKI